MQYKKIRIDLYDWTIYYIEAESPADAGNIRDRMKKIGISKERIKEVHEEIKNDEFTWGQHLFSAKHHLSVIFISTIKDYKDRIDFITHEIYHTAFQIGEYIEIEGHEGQAYIVGYIARKLAKIIYKHKVIAKLLYN